MGYDVWRSTTNDPTTAANITPGDTILTTFNDTTAVAGVTYYYWVKADNDGGSSAFSTGDSGIRALAVTTVAQVRPDNSYTTAQNLGPTTAVQVNAALSSASDVNWYQFTLTSPGDAYTQFKITFTGAAGKIKAALYANPAHSGVTLAGVDGAGTETLSLGHLAAGTYYVRVYGYAALSYSLLVIPPQAQQVAPVAPATPATVAASSTYSDGVHLAWTAPSGATGYQVWRSTTNDSTTAAELTTTDVTATSYVDTTAVVGTTYYYWIVADNSVGSSGYSADASGVRVSGPATVAQATNNTSYTTAQNLGTVTSALQVNGALASASIVNWYEFTISAAGDSTSQIVIAFTGAAGKIKAALYSDPAHKGAILAGTDAAGTETLSLQGLAAGTYYIRVYGSAALSYTLTVTPPVAATSSQPTSAPAATTGLTASNSTFSNGVHLSWTASTSATGYQVWRSTTNTSGSATKLTSTDVTATTYVDTTAVVGTTYYYWVVADNSAGSSGYSV